MAKALQIKLTKDRLTGEKRFISYAVVGEGLRNEVKTPKKPLGLRAYITFLTKSDTFWKCVKTKRV